MKIFNNFLTEEEKNYIQSIIASPKWAWGHQSIPNGNNSFWKIDYLEFDDFFNPHLLNKIQELTGNKFVIERIYMNGYTATNGGNVHNDSEFEQGRTFLIYCNPEWNIEWGGGTYFEEDDVIVLNKPYSAVYFQNNLNHCAMPLSKNFNGLRVTLAFKLLKI